MDEFQEDNDIYVVGDDSSKIEKWAFSDSTLTYLFPYNYYKIAFMTTEKNEFEYKDEYSNN